MALYPCDIGAHRYAGKQQTVYPCLLLGGQAQRSKLRLCPNHFVEYIRSTEGMLYGADDQDHPAECMFGKGDAIEGAVFLTYYESGQERQDLFGSTCKAHVGQVLEYLKIDA